MNRSQNSIVPFLQFDIEKKSLIILLNFKSASLTVLIFAIIIHVIFSWTQIGRSAIFGREIGVPDREIFSRQKIFKFNVKNCLFASP